MSNMKSGILVRVEIDSWYSKGSKSRGIPARQVPYKEYFAYVPIDGTEPRLVFDDRARVIVLEGEERAEALKQLKAEALAGLEKVNSAEYNASEASKEISRKVFEQRLQELDQLS